jgi:hypothetical protein
VRCFGRGKELAVGRAQFWGARRGLGLGDSTPQQQEHKANLRAMGVEFTSNDFSYVVAPFRNLPKGNVV